MELITAVSTFFKKFSVRKTNKTILYKDESFFGQLPNEIIVNVLELLDVRSLDRFAATSHNNQAKAHSDSLLKFNMHKLTNNAVLFPKNYTGYRKNYFLLKALDPLKSMDLADRICSNTNEIAELIIKTDRLAKKLNVEAIIRICITKLALTPAILQTPILLSVIIETMRSHKFEVDHKNKLLITLLPSASLQTTHSTDALTNFLYCLWQCNNKTLLLMPTLITAFKDPEMQQQIYQAVAIICLKKPESAVDLHKEKLFTENFLAWYGDNFFDRLKDIFPKCVELKKLSDDYIKPSTLSPHI